MPNKARWPGERRIGFQSVACSASSFSVASISSSSSMASLGNSSRPPNVKGVPGRVHTFIASARLDPTAGEPNDMGLSEHELCPDHFYLGPVLEGVVCVTGDPGARFRSAFSWSMTGDILGNTPTLAISNGGMQIGVSL